jgi:hypothetical protein
MATLTTPRMGLPYPDGSERVMDGDNAIAALAQAIDGPLGAAYEESSHLAPVGSRVNVDTILTDVLQDIPNTSRTFTVAPGVTEYVLFLAIVDMDVGTAAAGRFARVALIFDGSDMGQYAMTRMDQLGRNTIAQQWIVNLGAGPHTFLLRGYKYLGTAGSGVATVKAANTILTHLRFTGSGLIRDALGDTLEELPAPELER